jgi:hypothetical protein
MRSKTALSLATLVLGTALAAAPAFAQKMPLSPKSVNDGASVNMTGSPQTAPSPARRSAANSGRAEQTGHYYDYAPGNGSGSSNTGFWSGAQPLNQGGGCAARFHSYDPATGTYLGSDGARHACR